MRVWATLWVAMLLLLAICFYSNQRVSEGCKAMSRAAEFTRQVATQTDLKQTRDAYETMKTKWETEKHIWELFLYHDEVDAIERTMVYADSLISNGMFIETSNQCAILVNMFDHIPHNMKIRAENVF